MSDKQLIEFLWKLLWADLSDGDMPSEDDLFTLKEELTKRGILEGEFPS
jgi:hypothetical protein